MLDVKKMIDSFRDQIREMEIAVASLERLESSRTGMKKRGRPPLPRCEHGCGKPVHRGRCRGFKTRRLLRRKSTHA